MPSETLPQRCQDRIPLGPGDNPLTYGLNGEPITLREAIELLEDLEKRTLYETPIKLPSNREPAVVRTVLKVFDDDASRGPVPEDHVPQIYASILYGPGPQGRFIHALWTYGSAEEAEAGHPKAVDEFTSGRVRVPR